MNTLSLDHLSPINKIDDFDCGDADLDDFIHVDALDYQNNLLAETFLVKSSEEIIAYCALLNDRIGLEDFKDKTSFNKFRRSRFVNSKRMRGYPAIKVGRLAVDERYSRRGIGSQLLDFIKLMIRANRISGCRFLTVDAYYEAIPFYEKNGFVMLKDDGRGTRTIKMFYDLLTLSV